MKVICTISHEIPRGDGKFDVYEAGKVYDRDEYAPRYFTPVPDKKRNSKAEVMKNDNN
jgi:hypothetical protein